MEIPALTGTKVLSILTRLDRDMHRAIRAATQRTALVSAATALLVSCAGGPGPTAATTEAPTPSLSRPVEYGYTVVARYPHDAGAFTEGLVYDNGELYEGTGLVGKSSLRRVDLKNGAVEQSVDLPPPYFGEGITTFGDKIYQLTWQSKVGFIYDKAGFASAGKFSYDTEGWGLTQDGKRLIMSDGSRTLYYLDPQTLRVTGQTQVTGGPEAVVTMRLNELEYVKGEIYANVYPTSYIVIIDPGSGEVTGWVDLGEILSSDQREKVDVLNGIAYDAKGDRLFVTGKYWPSLFEIKLDRGK